MTGKQYTAAIARLGLTQRDAGKLLRVNERTSRRWVVDGPPWAEATILRLLLADWVSADLIRRQP